MSGASSVPLKVGDDVIAMQETRVFIVGDLILDSYVRGRVTRISPEAPVPVVLEQSQWAVLGGAANVAANVATFGATAVLAGRIGKDTDGKTFQGLCEKLGINCQGLVLSDTVPTTRKLRIMAGYQQLVRVDAEATSELGPHEIKPIIASFKTFLSEAGPRAVVISDYGKGVCTPELLRMMIGLANESRVPVVTDPKSIDMKRYAGSTIIKPNLSEGREMLKISNPAAVFKNPDAEIEAVCQAILEGASARNVVLSLSEKGVIARGQDLATPAGFSSTALQVADVSGAGDTMVSFLAMGMAAELGIRRAVKHSNIAAGIVCGKLGTSCVSAAEFLESFKDQTEETSPEKVLDREELSDILEQAREAGKTVVLTNGCFDLLHAGHVEILQKSKALGDILVVALNSDQSVRRLKGARRPVQNEADRSQIMAALACVDYVTLFDEDTPLEVITSLRPQVLVKGGDYTLATIVGAKEVISWGGRVEIIPLVSGKSTTSIIEKSQR